jgi:predicted PolB exonuclease-like 3'-5' exonuclease
MHTAAVRARATHPATAVILGVEVMEGWAWQLSLRTVYLSGVSKNTQGGCRELSKHAVAETAYIIFDTESVVDGALLAKVLYPGEKLPPADAVARYIAEQRAQYPGDRVFIPVPFQVPVAIAIARASEDFRLLDMAMLDAPRFDPQQMVRLFWRGVERYTAATLVDFNGRSFDLPLLTLSAFRFGISCPRYFADPDRYGFRNRYTSKHLDLMDWITEFGAFRLRGGLDLLAKMLGKPGKMETRGDQVGELFALGKLQEINDYCLHDVLDTYFVFLRTRVLSGELSLEDEQKLVADTRVWLSERSISFPGLARYLQDFGEWNPRPFGAEEAAPPGTPGSPGSGDD